MSDKWRRLLPQGNQEWLVTFGIQAATQVVMAGIFAYRGSYWLTAWSLVLTLVCLFFMRHVARKITKPQVVKPSYLNEQPSPLGESVKSGAWLRAPKIYLFNAEDDPAKPCWHGHDVWGECVECGRALGYKPGAYRCTDTGSELSQEDHDRLFLEHLKPGCTKGDK
jgi:hypothetical protein